MKKLCYFSKRNSTANLFNFNPIKTLKTSLCLSEFSLFNLSIELYKCWRSRKLLALLTMINFGRSGSPISGIIPVKEKYSGLMLLKEKCFLSKINSSIKKYIVVPFKCLSQHFNWTIIEWVIKVYNKIAANSNICTAI